MATGGGNDDDPLSSVGTDSETLAEALDQLAAIHVDEEDRRKTADGKISSAQNALGFTVTLAGGSAAFAFLQFPQYDLWHVLAILALVVTVCCFLMAAWKVADANEPRGYQRRSASGVRRMLRQNHSKRELQVDAINDLVSNVNANIDVTNERLGLYKDSVWWMRGAMIAVATIPSIILVGYIVNVLWGAGLPSALRINQSPSPSSSAAPTLSPSPTPTSSVKVVPSAPPSKKRRNGGNSQGLR